MPEEKTDWRVKVANAAETIIEKASELRDFLNMFFESEAGQLPLVRRTASVVRTAIEGLNEVISIAETILQEISKEEVNWEKIKEVFPTRERLGSIEDDLARLDNNPHFRGIMPFYYGSLKEDYLNHIWDNFQYMLNIFSKELGHSEIHSKFTEALASRPPTEKELEREYEEATGKRTLQPKELKSLFGEISKIFMRELEENPTFPAYWRTIASEFESAVDTNDTQKLRDIHRQIVKIYDSWIAPILEDLNEEERKALQRFFDAMRDYILRLRKSDLPLLKFKLIRRLLGLE
jgi:hypothetical protein